MQFSSIQKESFQTINSDTLLILTDYLSDDGLALSDPLFQKDVERYYTLVKKDLYSNYFWSFSKVHNYRLFSKIDPDTGFYRKFLPPDFIKLIEGFDKQGWAGTIYDTSFLQIQGIDFINYIRYVRDNDTLVQIPDYFKQLVSIKMATKLNIISRYSTNLTDQAALEWELYKALNNAITQDKVNNPFSTGISIPHNYHNYL